MIDKNQKEQGVHAEKSRWDNPIINMIVHVFLGTFLFLLVASAAYGVHSYVHWMQEHGVSGYLAVVLEGFANALATLDTVAVLSFFIKKVAKELGEE